MEADLLRPLDILGRRLTVTAAAALHAPAAALHKKEP